MKNAVFINFILFLFLIGCSYSQTQKMIDPFWTYFVDIYTGQHDIKNPTPALAIVDLTQGTRKFSVTRDTRKYRITQTLLTGGSVTANNQFSFVGIPKIAFSLQGVNQNAPKDGNTDYGFSCSLFNITPATFQTMHDVFGADITVLSYMYVTI
jgi:hypothetical protein